MRVGEGRRVCMAREATFPAPPRHGVNGGRGLTEGGGRADYGPEVGLLGPGSCHSDELLHDDLGRVRGPEAIPTLSVFDRSIALHHTGDDTDILDVVLRMFLEQGPERMGLVEAALAARDAKSLEREAHGLKGAAATLGMEDLRQASHAVERMGAEGRLDEAVAGVAAMRVAMDAAVAAIAREMA